MQRVKKEIKEFPWIIIIVKFSWGFDKSWVWLKLNKTNNAARIPTWVLLISMYGAICWRLYERFSNKMKHILCPLHCTPYKIIARNTHSISTCLLLTFLRYFRATIIRELRCVTDHTWWFENGFRRCGVDPVKILSHHGPGDIEGSRGKPHSVWPIAWLKFEPGTSRIE
jgi:hypothetical protein